MYPQPELNVLGPPPNTGCTPSAQTSLHRDTQLSLSPHLTLPTLETNAHQQLGSFLTLS